MMDDMSKRFRKSNGPIWNWSPSNVTLYIFVLFVDLKLAELHALGNSFGQVSKISVPVLRWNFGFCVLAWINGEKRAGVTGSKENIVKWCEGLKQSVSLLTVFLEDSWSVVVHDLMWWGVLGWQLVDVCCVGFELQLAATRDSGINHALVWRGWWMWWILWSVVIQNLPRQVLVTAIDPRSSRRLRRERRREFETSGGRSSF